MVGSLEEGGALLSSGTKPVPGAWTGAPAVVVVRGHRAIAAVVAGILVVVDPAAVVVRVTVVGRVVVLVVMVVVSMYTNTEDDVSDEHKGKGALAADISLSLRALAPWRRHKDILFCSASLPVLSKGMERDKRLKSTNETAGSWAPRNFCTVEIKSGAKGFRGVKMKLALDSETLPKRAKMGLSVQNISCFGMKASSAGSVPWPDGNMWQHYRSARRRLYIYDSDCRITQTSGHWNVS
ncbi:hypothetical protein EYF80_004500 [Liparis tanakae]|uniref:Uncharacterized protein n=1 Tax=Liparis tanakae TaxID=230148 RepID=A0A4Z2J4P1_9TELE|nr:hypothetical protein EYF80_004500 [Liparis tanakae]